ncbi:MAG: hypothetical protein ACI36V_07815 [Coriobacteriales bacterium]
MANASMTTISSFCLDAALAAIASGIANENVRVEAIPALNSRKVSLKVNFLAPGEVEPAEAAEYAGAILRAAQLTEACPANGAEVVYA